MREKENHKEEESISDTNAENMEKMNGEFTKLHAVIINNNNNDESITPDEESALVPSSNSEEYSDCCGWMNLSRRSKWILLALSALLSICALFVIKRYGPLFMHKEVIPVIHWLLETFKPLVLAAIVFAAIALLPILLLPTLPFKWVAGMCFGYGYGFLLIVTAEAVAVSLPYFIAYHLFLRRLRKWLDSRPREAAIIRLAGDGDWFHQFQAVVLIRVAPFPYVLFNYFAVVTGVKYNPYLIGSLLGMVPEIIVAIYSGILIRSMAEAMEDHTPVSKRQLLLDGIGFCLSVASTIAIAFYSKRRLKQLQEEEERLQLR